MKAPSALPGTCAVLFLIRTSGNGLKSCLILFVTYHNERNLLTVLPLRESYLLSPCFIGNENSDTNSPTHFPEGAVNSARYI